MAIKAPERLTNEHRLDAFRCCQPSLTAWLQDKARHNQLEGASNCFVVCDDAGDGKTVVGYYALAAGSVQRAAAPNAIRRNMPDPIPVAVLGRLAVHEAYEGQGLGGGLLKDATTRCIRTAQEGPGVRAMLCHAIDERAKAFYLHNGFVQSPVEPMTLMLNLSDVARRLTSPG